MRSIFQPSQSVSCQCCQLWLASTSVDEVSLTEGIQPGRMKSRVLGWETAEQLEKSIAGSGWGKTAEKRGLKVQSPILAWGGGPWTQKKKRRHVGKKKIYSKTEC